MTDTPRSQWDALNCRVNGRSLRAYWTVISCSRIWTWVKLLCAAHIGKPTSVLCLHLEVLRFPVELQGLLILSYVQSQKSLARVEMLSLTTFLCGFGGGIPFQNTWWFPLEVRELPTRCFIVWLTALEVLRSTFKSSGFPVVPFLEANVWTVLVLYWVFLSVAAVSLLECLLPSRSLVLRQLWWRLERVSCCRALW